VDDSNPYLAFLGIDWATDINGVINLKNHKMIFEKKSLLSPQETLLSCISEMFENITNSTKMLDKLVDE